MDKSGHAGSSPLAQNMLKLDKAGEIFKRKELFAGKVLPTHLFLNNKHYSFSVSEKAIGGL